MNDTLAIVLAAGLGTRMKSRLQKTLHKAAGLPLVCYPIRSLLDAGVRKVVVVVGHQAVEVEAAARRHFPGADLQFVVQAEQKGTAHATLTAREAAAGFRNVLVYNGDLPLVRASSLRTLASAFESTGSEFAFLSSELPDPFGFGRIVRDADGRPVRIVEEKDATPSERAIREANVGIYLARAELLFGLLSGVGTSNAKKEFYFTDVVALLAGRGQAVGVHCIPDADESAQVNDRVGLAEVERLLYLRKARALMEDGVTIHLPATVQIDDDCEVGRDTEIGSCVELHAGTRIGTNCSIGRGCVLSNVQVGDGVTVKPYCVFTDSRLADEVQAGPFTHLRPASVMERGSHAGNFVEMKKTTLGAGSKANHLTYLGDATIGAKVNIGAGTITCNYDGVNKLPTVIEDGAFIGSDTQLVAPVKVGRDAYVGAGTTVTRDVPAGALALSRAPQTDVLGYVERKRSRKG